MKRTYRLIWAIFLLGVMCTSCTLDKSGEGLFVANNNESGIPEAGDETVMPESGDETVWPEPGIEAGEDSKPEAEASIEDAMEAGEDVLAEADADAGEDVVDAEIDAVEDTAIDAPEDAVEAGLDADANPDPWENDLTVACDPALVQTALATDPSNGSKNYMDYKVTSHEAGKFLALYYSVDGANNWQLRCLAPSESMERIVCPMPAGTVYRYTPKVVSAKTVADCSVYHDIGYMCNSVTGSDFSTLVCDGTWRWWQGANMTHSYTDSVGDQPATTYFDDVVGCVNGVCRMSIEYNNN